MNLLSNLRVHVARMVRLVFEIKTTLKNSIASLLLSLNRFMNKLVITESGDDNSDLFNVKASAPRLKSSIQPFARKLKTVHSSSIMEQGRIWGQLKFRVTNVLTRLLWWSDSTRIFFRPVFLSPKHSRICFGQTENARKVFNTRLLAERQFPLKSFMKNFTKLEMVETNLT